MANTDTLSDLHVLFSDYLQEDAPPAESDVQYQRRTRWFNRSRESLANRWFFRNLLKSDSLSITAGDPGPYELPEDLERGNGLYYLKLDTTGTVLTDPYQSPTFTITRDLTTGFYQLTFATTPTTTETATISYFASPPFMADSDDLALVDTEVVVFDALTRHYLAEGNLNKKQEAQDERENRIVTLLRLQEINPPGGQTGMVGYEKAKGANEKLSYVTSRRRSLP